MIRYKTPRPGSRALAAMAAVAIVVGTAAAETIDIRLDTTSDTFNPGDAIDVDVFASSTSLLVGFGFDLQTEGALTLTGFDTESGFVGVGATPDGDRLAGLSFAGGVDGVDVRLGTAHFQAGDPGDALITLTTTPGDLTEGFARFGNGFFDIVTAPLGFSIVELLNDGGSGGSGGGGNGGGGNTEPPPVPEPATVVLLLTGMLAVVRRR